MLHCHQVQAQPAFDNAVPHHPLHPEPATQLSEFVSDAHFHPPTAVSVENIESHQFVQPFVVQSVLPVHPDPTVIVYSCGVTTIAELYKNPPPPPHHPRQAHHPPPPPTTNAFTVAILYILSDNKSIVIPCRSTKESKCICFINCSS